MELPENVRMAIMLAEAKKKHSTFWYKLCSLNDKIRVFTSIFYNNRQLHEKLFQEKRRQQELERLRRMNEIEEQNKLSSRKKDVKKNAASKLKARVDTEKSGNLRKKENIMQVKRNITLEMMNDSTPNDENALTPLRKVTRTIKHQSLTVNAKLCESQIIEKDFESSPVASDSLKNSLANETDNFIVTKSMNINNSSRIQTSSNSKAWKRQDFNSMMVSSDMGSGETPNKRYNTQFSHYGARTPIQIKPKLIGNVDIDPPIRVEQNQSPEFRINIKKKLKLNQPSQLQYLHMRPRIENMQ